MKPLFQTEIPKRNTCCAHLGEPLISGMEIYSLLIEDDQTEKLSRRDYCSVCWNSLKGKQENPAPLKSYWKSKIEKKRAAEGTARTERAYSLLRALLQEGEAEEKKIFVLCLFLSHARKIVLRQEIQNESGIYHLYEILHKEEFITVKAINLSDIQVEEIQKSIAGQLSIGLIA